MKVSAQVARGRMTSRDISSGMMRARRHHRKID